MTLISFKLNIKSLASNIQVKPVQQGRYENIYDFENRFKEQQAMVNYDNIFRNIRKVLNQNDNEKIQHGKEIPKVNKRLFTRGNLNQEYNGKYNINNKFSLLGEDKNLNDCCNTNKELNDALNNYNNRESYINPDEDYDYEINNLLAPKTTHSNALIYRREVPGKGDNNINLENSSLYPSVLTKTLQISLNPSGPTYTGGGLLNNVAQKLNTSTLDLAEKLTKSQNGQNNEQFAQMVQSYLTNNGKLLKI